MSSAEEIHESQPGPSDNPDEGLSHAHASGHDILNKQSTDAASQKELSKKEIKRLAKDEIMREKKRLKKQQAREERKKQQAQKKRALEELWKTMTPEEIEEDKKARKAKISELRQVSKDKKARLLQGLKEGQRIVIDYDFESYMHSGEIKSIVQQTNFSYGMNGKSVHPCHLILTSIKGDIEKAFDRQIPSRNSWIATQTSQSYLEMFANERDKLVYLTAEAEDEIQELDKDKIYVIGGIVDRNRHKGLCYTRAKEHGIPTARLPIGEYIKLSRSPVMCTNHVVEILVKWQETKDWEQAFDAVIPDRKRMGSLKDTS